MTNRLFEFGQYNNKLLFPLLNAFPCFLRFYFSTRILEGFKQHPLVPTFMMFLSEMLAGSLELIAFFRDKVAIEQKVAEGLLRDSEILIRESETGVKMLEKKDNSKRLFVVLLIISTATIDCITTTGTRIVGFYVKDVSNFEFEMKIFLLIFTGLFSNLILHIIIYKHQILAIILMSIGIILVSFYHLFYQDFLQAWFFVLIYLLLFCVYAIQNVTEHWIMRNKFFSPFKLIFFEGVVGAAICIFLFTFLWAIPCPRWNFCSVRIESIFETLGTIFGHWEMGLFFFLWIIASATYNNCIMITNYFFTPTHRTISDMISSFFSWIFLKSTGTLKEPWPLPLIGYLIIIFAVIVYHELIIMHFWGLSRDIKSEIMKRSLHESKLYPQGVNMEFNLLNN